MAEETRKEELKRLSGEVKEYNKALQEASGFMEGLNQSMEKFSDSGQATAGDLDALSDQMKDYAASAEEAKNKGSLTEKQYNDISKAMDKSNSQMEKYKSTLTDVENGVDGAEGKLDALMTSIRGGLQGMESTQTAIGEGIGDSVDEHQKQMAELGGVFAGITVGLSGSFDTFIENIEKSSKEKQEKTGNIITKTLGKGLGKIGENIFGDE